MLDPGLGSAPAKAPAIRRLRALPGAPAPSLWRLTAASCLRRLQGLTGTGSCELALQRPRQPWLRARAGRKAQAQAQAAQPARDADGSDFMDLLDDARAKDAAAPSGEASGRAAAAAGARRLTDRRRLGAAAASAAALTAAACLWQGAPRGRSRAGLLWQRV